MMNDKKIVEFVNPYNFVPLGQMKDKLNIEDVYGSRSNKDSDKELLSGYLDVSMYVKTPLIVPDAAHKTVDEKTGHASYEFFNVTNVTEENGEKKIEKNYIIPGSTLRGSIRSMYEAATNSCFPFLMDDKVSSYRLPLYMHMNESGLLYYDKEKEEWQLYEAEVTRKKLKNIGKIVTEENKYKQKENKFIDDKSKKEIKPGWDDSKRGEIVQCNVPVSLTKYHINYLKKKSQKPIKIWKDDTPYNELKSALSQDGVSGKKGTGKNAYYVKCLKKQLEKVKNGEKTLKGDPCYVPVYYIEVEDENENKLVYMSNASIGRIGQHRKWKDIVGEFSPCEDTSKLCPACMLFGTVNGKGMKGHVRFTDAVPVEEPEMGSYTLDILGKPRHSAYEFYLVQPPEENGKKIDYWNYDFRGTGAKRKGEDCKYKYYTPTIRGRKMYWHSENIKTTGTKGKLNATMEGVKAGSEFSFKVYFDEITKKQLNDLVWVISLGENKQDSKIQYKMGHGKPLGFGSVKLVVNSQTIRKIDDDLSVTNIKNSTTLNSDISFDLETVKALLKMANAETTQGLNVSYPIGLDRDGEEDTRVFSWFSENHKNSENVKTLPYPADSEVTLPIDHHS